MTSGTTSDSDARQQRFLALFLPQQGSVRAFIRSIVWDRARAEDLLQEVALVLWRELDRYDPDKAFGAWARGVAAKVVLRSLRDAGRVPLSLSPEAMRALESVFADPEFERNHGSSSEQEDALRECLARLPEKTRTLVRLRYEAALTANDIAARVKSTPEAVQKAIGRAREALQACVERRLRLT